MTKKEALKIIWDNYDEIKTLVERIEYNYTRKKGMYHEDLTHDLYVKIQNEIDKIEDKPAEVQKFLDRFYNGQTLNIYTTLKNMFIDKLRRENKYKRLDYTKLSKREKPNIIEESIDQDFDETILKDVNDYVDTFYWFDKKLFNLYRYEFKEHKTLMSNETKLSISTIYRTVKRCKVKIRNKFKDKYYER